MTAATSPLFGRFSWPQAAVCGLIAVAVDIAISVPRLQVLADGELLNPDSYMRLVRLDAILAAHAPISVVARDASGAGTELHWSHLLDSLLLVLALPLAPLFGDHEALHWAGVLLGPLSMGLLGAAVGWVAAPICDPGWRWTAAPIAATALPILGYAVPGVIHHHILVALSGVMCAGWAARASQQGAAVLLGAWAAFGLWLSPEAMPLALMAFCALAVGWLTEPRGGWGRGLADTMTTFAVLTLLMLLVDPPPAGILSVEVDRLSIVYLVLGVLGTGTAWCLWLLDHMAVRSRVAFGATAAAVAAAVWFTLFPQVLWGPEQILNGENAHAFDGIAEMLPVASAADAMLYLCHGTLAVVVAAVLAIRRRSPLFAYVTACLVLLLFAAAAHRRFATYPACAGAIATPVAITLISAALARRRYVIGAGARMVFLLSLLIAPLAPQAVVARAEPPPTCSVPEVVPVLQRYAGRIALAEVNATPELLYRTGLLTVGSLYHRNAAAYLRLRAAWRSQQLEHVPSAFTATGATLVLFCRHAARSVMVDDLPRDTLWDALSRNTLPPWLREISSEAASGWRVYELVAAQE